MNKSNTLTSSASKWSLLGLLVTLGIVYGDIGTSPLYVMKAIINANTGVDAEYIIGAVSCIIWTLTLQTTLKYVVLALRADNRGEGGILALYALIRKRSKPWMYLVAIIGAGTLVADGVITPSITVLSAIEGLHVYQPDIPIIPIVLTIIIVLFMVQQYGTAAIGRLFGPIMLLWFLFLGIMGSLHISGYWAIFKAFNPYHAYLLLTQNPDWFLVLGAVFLCTTGAEALYSDLGHCGKQNIRISWVFVKSMLILNYLGQGAWIISHHTMLTPHTNPFYAIIPRPLLLPGIILATLAAIIASQALISGSFTIFSEAMNLKLWPRQRIKYPTGEKGQLFIPLVNYSLMIGCIGIVLLFQHSSDMEAAYGLAITITMLMTTVLLVAYLSIYRYSKALVIPVAIVFVSVEIIFLLANLFKFVHGGWVTMMLAGLLIGIMYVWYNAWRIRREQEKFIDIRRYYPVISAIKEDTTIQKYASNIVYMCKADKKTELEQKTIYSLINKHPRRADHYWLLHVHYEDVPATLEYSFEALIPDTLYRVDLHLGFNVPPHINRYFRQIVEDLVEQKEFSLVSAYPSQRQYGIQGNFVFVIINRMFSSIDFTNLHDRLTMNLYSLLRHIRLTPASTFGLDTSNVIIENVPLVVHHSQETTRVQRREPKR